MIGPLLLPVTVDGSAGDYPVIYLAGDQRILSVVTARTHYSSKFVKEKSERIWSSSYKQTGGGEGTPVREEPTYCGLHRLVCSVENVLVYSMPWGRGMARVSQVE